MSLDLEQTVAVDVAAADTLSQTALVEAGEEAVALAAPVSSDPLITWFGPVSIAHRVRDADHRLELIREQLSRAMALNTGRWLANTRFVGFTIHLSVKGQAEEYRIPVHLNKPWIRSTLELRVEKRLNADALFVGKSIISAEDIAAVEGLVGIRCTFSMDDESVQRFYDAYYYLNETNADTGPLDRIPRIISRDDALNVLEHGGKVCAAGMTHGVSAHTTPDFPADTLVFFAAEGFLYKIGILKREERPVKEKKPKVDKVVKADKKELDRPAAKKAVGPKPAKKARVVPSRMKLVRKEVLILLPAKIEVEFIGQTGVYSSDDVVTVEMVGQEGDEYFRKVRVANLAKVKPVSDV